MKLFLSLLQETLMIDITGIALEMQTIQSVVLLQRLSQYSYLLHSYLAERKVHMHQIIIRLKYYITEKVLLARVGMES